MYKKIFSALIILSLIGVGVTTYLITQHYADAGTSFCNVNEYVSCDIVNKSTYSEIFGIPVSILGVVTYVILLLSAIAFFVSWKHAHKILVPVTFFTGAGVIFSLYLTFVEFFVLYAVCIFCLTQQIILFLIFITLLYLCSKQRTVSLFT